MVWANLINLTVLPADLINQVVHAYAHSIQSNYACKLDSFNQVLHADMIKQVSHA